MRHCGWWTFQQGSSCDCRTTSSIHYCRHRLLHHNITICENAHIHYSYLNILLTCQIVISSHTCCIKTLTRPIIPVLYRHWTGLEILFYCDIVFVYLHYPVVRPAFWHALNKRILIDWLVLGCMMDCSATWGILIQKPIFISLWLTIFNSFMVEKV